MKIDTWLNTGTIDGQEYYLFRKFDEKVKTYFSMILRAFEYLLIKEGFYKNVELLWFKQTIVNHEGQFLCLTKITIREKDLGLIKTYEGQELFDRITFIREKQDEAQEIAHDMESKIEAFGWTFEEEDTFLFDFVFSSSKEEQDKIYKDFLEKFESIKRGE